MAGNKKIGVILILATLGLMTAYSQSRKDIERKKSQKIKEIELTKKVLEETRKKKDQTLFSLKTIQRQIVKRNELIGSIAYQVEEMGLKLTDLTKKSAP